MFFSVPHSLPNVSTHSSRVSWPIVTEDRVDLRCVPECSVVVGRECQPVSPLIFPPPEKRLRESTVVLQGPPQTQELRNLQQRQWEQWRWRGTPGTASNPGVTESPTKTMGVAEKEGEELVTARGHHVFGRTVTRCRFWDLGSATKVRNDPLSCKCTSVFDVIHQIFFLLYTLPLQDPITTTDVLER